MKSRDAHDDPRPEKKRPSRSGKRSGRPLTGLVGFGLDAQDEHKRLTRGDDFVLLGGSAETHERMQDLVVRMSETLRRRGQSFADLSRREFEDLARDTLR